MSSPWVLVTFGGFGGFGLRGQKGGPKRCSKGPYMVPNMTFGDLKPYPYPRF